MSERLTDEEIAEFCDGHDYTPLHKIIAMAREIRGRRVTDLELDDYEAVNLLWLVRVAQHIHLDTGDWCGQIMHKLEAREHASVATPNSPPGDTASRLHMAALKTLGLTPTEWLALKRQRDILVADPLTDRAAITAIDKILGAKQ